MFDCRETCNDEIQFELLWGLQRAADGWRIDRMNIEFHGPVEGYFGVYQLAAERLKGQGAAQQHRRPPAA